MRKFFIVWMGLVLGTGLLLMQTAHSMNEPLADSETLKQIIQEVPLDSPPETEYAEFHGEIVTPPQVASLKKVNRVLGTTSAWDKRIEVDLTNQRVYAYEGNRKVFDFIISSGKWGRTPTGTFRIWAKIRSQLMKGGSKELGTYYYLPNVPWVQFFYNSEISKYRGFSFHGTYWHNNFGRPMSHGCINMITADAALLFEWTSPTVTNPRAWATYPDENNPGTEVVIYGVAPRS